MKYKKNHSFLQTQFEKSEIYSAKLNHHQKWLWVSDFFFSSASEPYVLPASAVTHNFPAINSIYRYLSISSVALLSQLDLHQPSPLLLFQALFWTFISSLQLLLFTSFNNSSLLSHFHHLQLLLLTSSIFSLQSFHFSLLSWLASCSYIFLHAAPNSHYYLEFLP